MSVWSNPCYAIEPLRNAANNLPPTDVDAFPEELAGIADFTFGDCKFRYPDRAGKRASDFFRDNPAEWKKFCLSGKRNLIGLEALKFRNTLRQTKCAYSGIRAVYWAFSKIRKGDWKLKETIETEDLLRFTSKAYKLAAAPSRINQTFWENAQRFYEEGADTENSWATREATADAARYLWTLKTGQKVRRLAAKTNTIIERALRSCFTIPKTNKDLKATLPKEVAIFRSPAAKPFDTENAKAKYLAVTRAVRAGEAISTEDAVSISTLPYTEVPSRGGQLVVFGFRGGLILYDRYEKRSAFFLGKDWDRVVQMLQSDAKLTMYYSKYEHTEPELSSIMISKYERIMDDFLSDIDVNSDYKCNRYCRAYDVYQFVFLASLADDITDRAMIDQMEKVDKEDLNSIVNMSKFMRIIDDDDLGIKEILELLKFNKIFPCPDFCTYSVCDNLEAKANDTHPCSESAVVYEKKGKVVTVSVSDLKNYMLRNRLLNFYNVHGFLPGKLDLSGDDDVPFHLRAYPAVEPERIRIGDMAFINIENTFMYRDYNGCEVELVKDKVVAPTVSKSDTRKISEMAAIERNQVLKYLFSKDFIPQSEVIELAKSGELFSRWKRWILLALKAEAKKPGSRAFSMATDEYRRLLSEFEANVSSYTSKQSGSSVGKSTKDLDERLGAMTETPLLTTTKDLVTHAVMFSFDLAGFSPQQNPRFKEMGVDCWSHVFGKPELKSVLNIFNNVEMTFDKFGVVDKFLSRGNDLEGFQGKMNTSSHIDLMGYAVSKMKEAGIAAGAAQLEVLIDDGLLRAEILVGDENTAAAMDIIEKTYAFAGQKISWDKTFVSRVLAQYLNRVFYDGVEVTPGAKAFMRIGKKQECAIPTLSEELMSHASATRGAIQNGSNHYLAYYSYIVECYKSLRIWGMKDFSDSETDRMAFALYVPVGLGGFGASTLYGLSTNESFNALQAGIATMKMICFNFRGYAPMANTYLNAGVRPMDAESILRNPCAIRTKMRCLNLRRFSNAARAYVLGNSKNTLIMKANLGLFDGMEVSICEEMMKDNELSEVRRKLLWDMTFKSYLDSIIGKLQNSQTAASLLGKRLCIRILIQNRMEARHLIRETATGNFKVRAA